MWANNPVGIALVEATGILEWPRDSLRVLSLWLHDNAVEHWRAAQSGFGLALLAHENDRGLDGCTVIRAH